MKVVSRIIRNHRWGGAGCIAEPLDESAFAEEILAVLNIFPGEQGALRLHRRPSGDRYAAAVHHNAAQDHAIKLNNRVSLSPCFHRPDFRSRCIIQSFRGGGQAYEFSHTPARLGK